MCKPGGDRLMFRSAAEHANRINKAQALFRAAEEAVRFGARSKRRAITKRIAVSAGDFQTSRPWWLRPYSSTASTSIA